MDWLKLIVIIFMLMILFSLFRGLFFLTKGGDESKKQLLKSLQWRIALSTLLFAAILALHYFGIIDLRTQLLPN